MGGFCLHPVSFLLTGLALLVGSQLEYLRITRASGVKPQTAAGICSGICLYILSALIGSGILETRYFLVIMPVIPVILILELYRKQDKPFDSLAHTFFSLVYIALPFSLFPLSAFSREGMVSLLPHPGIAFSPGIIVGFFLLLWTNDTGAYITGSLFGKHRLMERVSPLKSWEGFFGGTALSAAAAWLLSDWLGVVEPTDWVIISIIISVAGTYGDLVESMLKRSFGIKDSGNIMPGHGGFLDRFDSTVTSFPLVFLFISFFA
jgi:phosphatidate cytidylyltransferase